MVAPLACDVIQRPPQTCPEGSGTQPTRCYGLYPSPSCFSTSSPHQPVFAASSASSWYSTRRRVPAVKISCSEISSSAQNVHLTWKVLLRQAQGDQTTYRCVIPSMLNSPGRIFHDNSTWCRSGNRTRDSNNSVCRNIPHFLLPHYWCRAGTRHEIRTPLH